MGMSNAETSSFILFWVRERVTVPPVADALQDDGNLFLWWIERYDCPGGQICLLRCQFRIGRGRVSCIEELGETDARIGVHSSLKHPAPFCVVSEEVPFRESFLVHLFTIAVTNYRYNRRGELTWQRIRVHFPSRQ